MEYVLRLEILEDLPDVDTIFVPVGGGGLISGIAVYVKAIKPSVKVLKITKQFLVFLLFLFGLQKHTLIVYLAHPFLKNISQIYTTLRQINEQRRNILCKVSTRNSLPPPFSPKESLLPLTPTPPPIFNFLGIQFVTKLTWIILVTYLQIIGCQPEKSCVMFESFKAGEILDLESYPTVSDGTAGGVDPNAVS